MTYEDFLLKQLEKRADRVIKEEHDPEDKVTFDVPLFIRLLELAREDLKTDADLHHVVDRVLAIKDRGVLTMDDYEEIQGGADQAVSADEGTFTNSKVRYMPGSGRGAEGYAFTPKYQVGSRVTVKGYQGAGFIAYIKHRGDVGVKLDDGTRVKTTIDDLRPTNMWVNEEEQPTADVNLDEIRKLAGL